MIKFRRKEISGPIVELTAVVDLVFILLVFFLLSSVFLKPVIKLDLPVAGYRETAERQIVVAVAKDKKIFINQQAVEVNSLKEKVAALVKANPAAEVVFAADQKIDYGFFVQVMDRLKAAGATSIALEHDLKQ